MSYQLLSSQSELQILDYLELPVKPPTLRYLNSLVYAYIRKVPWESVSRIVKRRMTPETKDCPRWPEEFWNEAIQNGFGGTCYESSLAFISLLVALGFEGYLTVNDMGSSKGCHAAITIVLNGKKYLVDITIPLHSAVRINPEKDTHRRTTFHNYTIQSVGNARYEVVRSHHHNRNAFTLVDIPVDLAEFQQIVENDYLETGHFLKSVVIAKIIGSRTWRFSSDHVPCRIENFDRKGKNEIIVRPDSLAQILSILFLMPKHQISAALNSIQSPPPLDPLSTSFHLVPSEGASNESVNI